MQQIVLDLLQNALIAFAFLIITIGLISIGSRKKKSKFVLFFFSFFSAIRVVAVSFQVLSLWQDFSRTVFIFNLISAVAAVPMAILLIRFLGEVLKRPRQEQWARLQRKFDEQVDEGKEKDAIIEKIREFEFFADSLPQIAWSASPTGDIEYYNKNWYEYTGLSPEESLGRGGVALVHPDDVDSNLSAFSEALKNGKPFLAEFRFKRGSDGAYRWHHAKGVPMMNASGRIARWFGIITDIHDFRETIDEISAVKTKMELILQHAPLGIWAVNKEGIFTLSEGKGIRDAGYQSGELVGQSFFELYQDFPEVVSCLRRALNGEEFTEETDVHVHVYNTTFGPIRNPEGEIIGVVGISYDITKDRKSETASQFKSRFLASMSHGIRTPLNVITGFADILKNPDLEPARRSEYVDHINTSGHLLLKLVEDIFDLSRFEEGSMELQNRVFNYREVLRASIMPYKLRVNDKGLEFKLFFDDDIPEFLCGDSDRIVQIILNLLSNSLKFTNQGSINIKMDTRGPVQNGQIEIGITVSDTGIGIPQAKQEFIFEAFTQGDKKIAKDQGGAGLGLSLVRQLLDLMGGKLALTSPLPGIDHGTEFSLTIRLKVPDAVAIKGRPATRQTFAPFDRQIHVLVVEDVDVNQVLAEIILKDFGCLVSIASNGREALEYLEDSAHSCDLIFMDIQMPVMDGYAATRVIRRVMQSQVPIIGLSANVFEDDVKRSMEAGMNAHMSKPYTRQQIHDQINRWVIEPATAQL